MDKDLEIALLMSSAQMEIEELLDGKSGEFKEAFFSGLDFGTVLNEELMKLYLAKFKDS